MPALTPTPHPRRHTLSWEAWPRNEHKSDQRLATAAHPPDGERGAAERRTSRPGPSQQHYALVPGGDALRRARLPVFTVQRLGVVMAPEPGNPLEVEGVLNPAGAVGPDGQYYLFPRLVAAGNYSRIGVARVRRDGDDRPSGVERLGVALEPQMPYELVRPGVGGCEDPRITYLPCANVYVMAYTALGLQGPHVALASSRDLRTWWRHGPVDFAPERSTDFNLYTNKDALLLPEPVVSPSGERALALLHRPIYEMRLGGDRAAWVPAPLPPGIADARPSMWISYCALGDLDWLGGKEPPRFAHHHLLATPREDWESSRIGGGTVPLPTPDGWLTFYHGVHVLADGGRCYQTGALLLDRADPRQVLARTAEPIFGPEMLEERVGMVGNVVFPTAVEERGGGLDVYYGMADSRIGCAHLPSVVGTQMSDAA